MFMLTLTMSMPKKPCDKNWLFSLNQLSIVYSLSLKMSYSVQVTYGKITCYWNRIDWNVISSSVYMLNGAQKASRKSTKSPREFSFYGTPVTQQWHLLLMLFLSREIPYTFRQIVKMVCGFYVCANSIINGRICLHKLQEFFILIGGLFKLKQNLEMK